MMYYVNWVLTTAQLELIAADVSVVDYGKDKKKREKGDFDDTPASAESIREANEKWLERYGNGETAGAGLEVGEILGGGFKADVGLKLD